MGKVLKIKVCGIKVQENLKQLEQLGLDYVGHIFFEKSPRNILQPINGNVDKVGVFVNASLEFIQQKVSEYNLKVVQLHGGESEEFLDDVKELGVQVWKVFSIGENFDFSQLTLFENADAFLLDTKSPQHGGTGKKFDWSVLERIDETTIKPFYLSGGVGPNDTDEIKSLKLKNLIGLDLNSQFEIQPGLKDIEKLKTFIQAIRN